MTSFAPIGLFVADKAANKKKINVFVIYISLSQFSLDGNI